MGKACRLVSLMGKACRLEGAQFSRLLSTRSIPYPSTDLIRDETRYQTYWAQSIFRGATNKNTWSLLHIFEHPFANSFWLIFILAFCSLPPKNKRTRLNVRFAKNKKRRKKFQQQTSSSAWYLCGAFLSKNWNKRAKQNGRLYLLQKLHLKLNLKQPHTKISC